MKYIENRSCVRFNPRTLYNENYLYITKGAGCSSEVGLRHTGRQLMNINEQLCPRGKIIHELLHALGFLHVGLLLLIFKFVQENKNKNFFLLLLLVCRCTQQSKLLDLLS
jgi:hypothetical protein